MMRLIPVACCISLLTALFSCGDDPKKESEQVGKEEERSFQEFYYPTVKDGETRYYQYFETIETGGQDPYSFISTKRMERKGDTLIFVEYQHFKDTTIAVDSSLNRIEKDGIHYLESYFSNGNWVKFDGVEGRIIIPWNWKKTPETTYERSVSADLSELSGRDPMKFVSKIKQTSFDALTDAFDGHKKYAVVKGKGKYELGSSLPEFDMTYWYLEGVGLYFFKMSAPPNTFSSLLEKELTEKEYKDLFR